MFRKTLSVDVCAFFCLFKVRTLFVSGLPMDARPRELHLLFRAYKVSCVVTSVSRRVNWCFDILEVEVVTHFWHKLYKTRMWANAQHHGRPAEYRWRPLFNAAKFASRPLLECRAVGLTLPRRETQWNLLGYPTRASGPKVIILGGHLGRHCCLTSFFSDYRYVL